MPNPNSFTLQDSITNMPDVSRFFVGWKTRPSQKMFKQILDGSDLVVTAIDVESGETVGFATAITDGVFVGYISLVEVLPSHQGKGIGSTMVKRLKERLGGLYMVDTVCDEELTSFYEKLGMKRGIAMSIRNNDAIK